MENQQNIDSVVNNKDIVINNFKEEDKYDCFKNQKILSNKGFMIIILDCFNDEFIYYEHKEVKRKKFINIIYKSPTIFLNGLTFETPWMKTVKDCYSIYNNNTKYWLEQTFIDYQDDSEINLFLQIMNNIDKNVINYLDSYKNYLELDDNIKNNIFDRKEDSNKKDIYNNEYYLEHMDYDNEDLFCKNIKIDNEDKYFYIKNKIDVYLKNIIVNNEKYDGNITQLKLKDSVIKTTITCGGLWKYNNK